MESDKVPEKIIIKQFDEMLDCLFKSIQKNKSLLQNTKYTHEQSISHRIACDFEIAMLSNKTFSNLIVDCEYSKHGENPKQYRIDLRTLCETDRENKVIDNKIEKIKNYYKRKNNKITEDRLKEEICNKYFRPDIILHKRGNDNFNILAIEIKKNYRDITFDKIKLKVLTGLQYNYKIGLSLALKKHNEYKPTFTFYVQEDYYKCFIAKVNTLKDYIQSAIINIFVVVNNQGKIEYLEEEDYIKYSQEKGEKC